MLSVVPTRTLAAEAPRASAAAAGGIGAGPAGLPGGAEVVFVCQYEAGKLMHEEALSTQDLELIFGPGKVRRGGAGLGLAAGWLVEGLGGWLGWLTCLLAGWHCASCCLALLDACRLSCLPHPACLLPACPAPAPARPQQLVEKRRRLRRMRRRQVRLGETIYKGHRSYDLMLNLQLGIRYTITTLNKLPPPPRMTGDHYLEKVGQ